MKRDARVCQGPGESGSSWGLGPGAFWRWGTGGIELRFLLKAICGRDAVWYRYGQNGLSLVRFGVKPQNGGVLLLTASTAKPQLVRFFGDNPYHWLANEIG